MGYTDRNLSWSQNNVRLLYTNNDNTIHFNISNFHEDNGKYCLGFLSNGTAIVLIKLANFSTQF